MRVKVSGCRWLLFLFYPRLMTLFFIPRVYFACPWRMNSMGIITTQCKPPKMMSGECLFSYTQLSRQSRKDHRITLAQHQGPTHPIVIDQQL